MEGVTNMMQPIDIKTQNFGKGLFGYKKSDVDQYVDTVYRAYDELFTENKNLRDEKDRLNKVIEENRLKIFELENNQSGSAAPKGPESASDAFETIKEEAKASDPVTETLSQDDPFSDLSMEFQDIPKNDEKKEEAVEEKKGEAADKAESKDSATSKFFQQSNDDVFGDGDDVFVGEIEDNRKPSKVMIGDGEEEGADDFEFL